MQWCTRDYLQTLEAAGLQPEILSFDSDQRWIAKLMRRVAPRPNAYQIPPTFIEKLIGRCQQSNHPQVFLNNTITFPLTVALRNALGSQPRIVMLSHGVENTDLVNALRLAPQSLPRHMRHPSWLGRTIQEEIHQRQAIDLVICICQEDVLFEQWLGAPQCLFLPRSIEVQDLNLKPLAGRVGCVATLNHEPNVDGIRQLAKELDCSGDIVLRLVGGPVEVGKRLQEQFNAIEYVGRLSDEQLFDEAATWSAFVNPVFCQARGASTKVATALGWGLPVATTVVGARGYCWDESVIPLARSRKGLAEICRSISYGDSNTWQMRAKHIRGLAPTLTEAGELIEHALESIPRTGKLPGNE